MADRGHNEKRRVYSGACRKHDKLFSEDIQKIVIGGIRSKDYYLRLLLAGVPAEKIVCTENELDTVKYLSLEKGETVYILFELYADPTARKVKESIEKLLTEKKEATNND